MNRCPGGGCVFAKTKSVVQYDLEGNILNEFESVVEAERSTDAVKITGCCKGYNSTSGGLYDVLKMILLINIMFQRK